MGVLSALFLVYSSIYQLYSLKVGDRRDDLISIIGKYDSFKGIIYQGLA